MSQRVRFVSSSVGTKIIIGLSGLFLILYLLIHVGGNLLVFLGPQVFNTYAYNMEVRNPTTNIGVKRRPIRLAQPFQSKVRFNRSSLASG